MGGGSKGSSSQQQTPGTLSPITAMLFDIFGGRPSVQGGQFVPGSFGGPGSMFGPEAFAAIPGLLQNQPLSGVESFILGAGPAPNIRTPIFDEAGYQAAVAAQAAAGRKKKKGFFGKVFGGGGDIMDQAFGMVPGMGGGGGGAGGFIDPAQFTTYQDIPGGSIFGANAGFQDLALQGALQGQELLSRTAGALDIEPTGAINQARRSFEQETMPEILERAPGFSSSDVQRELFRAGADVETQVAALRDQHQLALAQTIPQFSQALGTNLLSRASDILGFGSLGREFVRETGPAGDAFRTLTALQSLTGPGFTTFGTGSSKSKSTQVL